jgi:FAD/FMN-containing dehydrogenase
LSLKSGIPILKESILATGCEVFELGTDGYARSIGIWNGAVERKLALIARCLTINDVQAALAIAQRQGLEISVRGGGTIGRDVPYGMAVS